MSDSEHLENVPGSPWRIIGEFSWLEQDLRVASEAWDQAWKRRAQRALFSESYLPGPRGSALWRSSPSAVEIGSQAVLGVLDFQRGSSRVHPGKQGSVLQLLLEPPCLAV